MTTFGHRLRQFWRSLDPQVSDDEAAFARLVLTDGEQQLFAGMSLRDQRHCLDVAHTLRSRWPDASPRTVRLCLLHDIGKQLVPFRLWERVLVVLWRRSSPPADPLRHDCGRPWQMSFQHPEYGARLAAQAGCTEELVSDIRQHHTHPPPLPAIADFQWADDLN